MKERIYDFIAYKLLPRRLVLLCAVRVMTHASMVNSSRHAHLLTSTDCIKAWNVKIS